MFIYVFPDSVFELFVIGILVIDLSSIVYVLIIAYHFVFRK